jgi:hypothetical protein
MSDRVADLEARIAELSESMRLMERRVGVLERGLSPAAARRVRAAAAPDGDAAAAALLRSDAASVAGSVSLTGRTLLVLAGAFLLRALTDSGKIPTSLGVALAFVYAGVSIAAADRAAGRGLLASAGFHGAAAVAIGFPLLFEATSKFKLLPTSLSAVLLTAFTAVALAVAVRRRFQVFAWLVVVAAIPTAFALMLAAGRVAPPLVFLVLLGAATLWLGYVLDWHGLRWPAAAAANLAVLFLAVEAVRPGAPDGPVTAVLLQFALVAAYLGSTAVRTLGLRRNVVPFELVQAAAVLVVGLGGAAFVTAKVGMGATALGALSLAFGAGAYGVAFAFVERRQHSAVNFYYYTTIAIAFVLAGATFLLPAVPRAIFWAALALGTAVAARRAERITLAAHAAGYAVVAAIASGLLAHAGEAAFASPAHEWSPAPAAAVAVAAALAAAAWALATAPVRSRLHRAPRVVFVVVLAASAAGLLIGWISAAVAGAPGAGADAGIVATVRTAVLALGALALAGMGRTGAWMEARWLAWPVLAVTGVKLLVEDLPRSRPATLFLAFAVYGVALILVPRLRRRDAAVPPPHGAT